MSPGLTEQVVDTAYGWLDGSMFSLAVFAVLGMAIGYMCGRLIGAGRDLSGAMALIGLAVGLVLFGIATYL